jgi:hypothetical protein
MIERIVQATLSILLGGAAFALARYFAFQALISLGIGAAVSVLTFISGALDFVKKWLEIRKLKREVDKLDRERRDSEKSAQDKNNLVRLATSEETKTYGVSILERKLEIYRRLEEEKETLRMRTFLSRTRESKTPPRIKN